jgi:hypothetical protein
VNSLRFSFPQPFQKSKPLSSLGLPITFKLSTQCLQVDWVYIASDIRALYSGMVIAVDYHDWSIFRQATITQIAVLLVDLARTCHLAKLKKKKRGVKKPKLNVQLDKSTPHVSTLKLLSGNA